MIDQKTFIENQNRFPAEELAKYEVMFVAWSRDGTQILAADKDYIRLYRSVAAAGHDMKEIMIEGIVSGTHLGGPMLMPEETADDHSVPTGTESGPVAGPGR
jgi:hypothetical protein